MNPASLIESIIRHLRRGQYGQAASGFNSWLWHLDQVMPKMRINGTELVKIQFFLQDLMRAQESEDYVGMADLLEYQCPEGLRDAVKGMVHDQ